VWHGWANPEDADKYEEHLRPELLPGSSNMPGFLGSYLLRRAAGDEVEFVTIYFVEGAGECAGGGGSGLRDGGDSVIPE